MSDLLTIIFDIDGTLADIEHRKHHIEGKKKDWEAFYGDCHNDAIIPQVEAIYRRFVNSIHYRIIIVTGRPESARQKTVDWLRINDFKCDDLYMRKEGDFRTDDVIKEEILSDIREKYGEPFMVFEDRARVVGMWRRNGVFCLQVADGDF